MFLSPLLMARTCVRSLGYRQSSSHNPFPKICNRQASPLLVLQVYETNALNQQRLPARQADRLDEFTIDIEEGAPGGGRVFFVQGKALQKFTQVGAR